MLDIFIYLDAIKDIDYAISKYDVPYMPKKFPLEYPIGKDMDILVSQLDFKKIIDITINFFNLYKSKFTIKIIKGINNFKLRLENNNKLHYQIDITVNNNLIKNKTTKLNFYILSLENELIVRTNEVKKNPKKLHHKVWITNYNLKKNVK
jgi:hypothetical protein